MRKVYFKTTHSAATEPAEVTHCIDCDEFIDECVCGEPRCDYCGEAERETEQMEWNGDTGCHVECEREADGSE